MSTGITAGSRNSNRNPTKNHTRINVKKRCVFRTFWEKPVDIFSAATPRSRHRVCDLCVSVLVLCFCCVDRGLLQLIAFCSLQVLDRSFYLCVFVCVLFLHVSAYICMFLTFSVSSFRASAALAFCKCCCRKATKILDNCARIH